MMTTIRNFRGRSSVLLGALLLACVFASVGSAAALPLKQPGTGTVTGRVLSLDNVPLPNVRLAAFAQGPDTPNRTALAEFQTDAEGRYAIQVPAGIVWIEFLTQDIGGRIFWGYSNLPVNVAAGQTVSGQDFRVAFYVVPPTPTAPAPLPGMPPAPTVSAPPTPMVSAPPTPTTSAPLPGMQPTPGASVPLPGMPTTGAGPDLLPLLAGGLGLLLLLFGLAQRRAAR